MKYIEPFACILVSYMFAVSSALFFPSILNQVACKEPKIKNGDVRPYQDIYEEGNKVKFRCSKGYVIDGSIFSECKSNGRWSNSSPSCIRQCENPIGIKHGKYLPKREEYKVGDVVTYQCQFGYYMSGDSLSACLGNATFTKAPKCNPNICRIPPPPINGKITNSVYPGNVNMGQYIIFECNPGYRLVGAARVLCTSKKEFDLPLPTCERMSCYVHSIANGNTIPPITVFLGNSVKYSCHDGYKIEGNFTRNCLLDGTLEGEEPTCTEVVCVVPNIENGSSFPRISIPLQKAVMHSCNDGYTLQGSKVRICETNKQLSGTPPVCIKKENCLVDHVTNGHASAYDIEIGETVYFACESGYTLTGSQSRICQSDHTLSGENSQCVEDVECLIPPLVHGVTNPRIYASVGSKVTYQCSLGYRLEGDDVNICLNDGTMFIEVPKCVEEVMHCEISALENGFSYPEDLIELGGSVKYTCQEGYELVGPINNICEINEKLKFPPPLCREEFIPVICTVVGIDDGAPYPVQEVIAGEVVQYTCDHSFRLIGAQKRLCMKSGLLEGYLPRCEKVPETKCKINNIANGFTVPVSDVIASVKVTYTCNNGYKIVGNDVRTCLANGDLLGNEPTCEVVKVIDCKKPTLQNGYVSSSWSTIKSGETIYFVCHYGYTLDGANTGICNTNGVISGGTRVCVQTKLVVQETRCNHLPDIPNGLVFTSDTVFRVGSTVILACDYDYQLIGEDTATCRENGQFFVDSYCMKKREYCKLPTFKYPLKLQGKERSEYSPGQEIIFECAQGYYITHRVIKCLSDGTFSRLPHCIKIANSPKRSERQTTTTTTSRHTRSRHRHSSGKGK